MAPERSPAFQFYAKDFLSDEHVIVMDCASRGAYITLLAVCWLEGSLPTDDRALFRLAGSHPSEWKRIKDDVLACFFERDGRYYQKRLELEREKQNVYRQRQANAGRRSAEHRLNHGSTTVDDTLSSGSNQKPSLLSPSSSSSPKTPTVSSDRFDRFWDAYPKKTAKPDAEKAFASLKVSESLLEIMLAAIARQRQSRQWQDKQYIPGAGKWLRGHRWDDEVDADPALVRKVGPDYSAHWYTDCPHDPKCQTGPMCRQQQGIDAMKHGAVA